MLDRTTDTKPPINLAHVAPFRLGAIEVHPATRQLIRGNATKTLEPRVMQVLVAFAQSNGAVVTRDELTDLCWDGRIVSENAINRVISRLRQIASEFARGSFEIETITKVGYRIVPAGDAPSVAEGEPRSQAPEPQTGRGRRGFIVAGLGIAAIGSAGGWFAWNRSRRHEPVPQALELYRRGQFAQKQGFAAHTRQAISLYREATRIDPLFSDAWGALALSYRHVMEGAAAGELASLPGLIKSAGERALALDADNADAHLALVIMRPYFRNWRWMEADLIRLGERFPGHWFIQAQLGIIRYEVGRWRDGLPHTQRQLEIDSFIPIGQMNLARALWSSGRLQEAEAVTDAAVERWPGHFALWNFKYGFLLFTGRPASAAAFIEEPEARPEELPPTALAFRRTLARAIERREPAEVEASVATLRKFNADNIAETIMTAPTLVHLGRPDLAMSDLELYYLGGRPGSSTPPGPLDRRYTQYLFTPPMAPLWPTARFAALLERIGLERYWRESRKAPDFRRQRQS